MTSYSAGTVVQSEAGTQSTARSVACPPVTHTHIGVYGDAQPAEMPCCHGIVSVEGLKVVRLSIIRHEFVSSSLIRFTTADCLTAGGRLTASGTQQM
jgi:hypothetical protein